jgi:hypothetical protein
MEEYANLAKTTRTVTHALSGTVPCKGKFILIHLQRHARQRTNQVYCGSLSWREKTLEFGQHFGWSFNPSTVEPTCWMCGFKWRSKLQQFLVWADQGMSITTPASRACLHCEWHLMRDGFYLSDAGLVDQLVLYHQWLY